jgi:hypothetical protein
VRFGRQRPAGDLAALALLFLGFSGLAVAVFFLRETLFGALLPLAFVAGAIAGLRAEVRELELRDDRLILRTFFRGYGIPKAHIKAVVMTPRGVAIDVLNGARYAINPPGVDAEELQNALLAWWRG